MTVSYKGVKELETMEGISPFQQSFLTHLVQWKKKHLTKEPGVYGGREYDVLLPREYKKAHQPLYRPIVEEVIREHTVKNCFGNMASSQTACINLFTPVLRNPVFAERVLGKIKTDFHSLADNRLESGFQFDYWDTSNPLNDHVLTSGTEVDIAIAYYNSRKELCYWLIDHKLTENDLEHCRGYESSGNLHKNWCGTNAAVEDAEMCYCQYACGCRYWEWTGKSGLYSEKALAGRSGCPFRNGENQLWRKQLMAHAMRSKGIKTHYSVVCHHENLELKEVISRYRTLLTRQSEFSLIVTRDIIQASSGIRELRDWVCWYSELYRL